MITDSNNRHGNKHVFAAVRFANAAPLAYFLGQQQGVEVIYHQPSQLMQYLQNGQADAALIPVMDYFACSGLTMIDGLGICADGEVWSVLLKCNRPIEQVRTVRPDSASRTSNALAKILFHEHFNLSVEMDNIPADSPVDAEVVIGDRALKAAAAPCGDYDLAGLWKSMTGLPFVFAVWVHMSDHPAADKLSQIAHAARQAGGKAIDQLATIYADKLGVSQQRCGEYFTSAIHYDVGSREKESMRLFHSLLVKTGAIAAEGVSQ